VRLSVRAHPGAARGRTEWREGVLHVWVAEPAVEGAANRAVIRAVAEVLGVRRSQLRLVSGERSRQKLFDVDEA
jgi:uncharacterized protein